LLKDQFSIFSIGTFPDTDFRIDCMTHTLNKMMPLSTPLTMRLTGENKKERQTIFESEIVPPSGNKSNFDFSFVMKKIERQMYRNLQI
jgi:hypothetical protein